MALTLQLLSRNLWTFVQRQAVIFNFYSRTCWLVLNFASFRYFSLGAQSSMLRPYKLGIRRGFCDECLLLYVTQPKDVSLVPVRALMNVACFNTESLEYHLVGHIQQSQVVQSNPPIPICNIPTND